MLVVMILLLVASAVMMVTLIRRERLRSMLSHHFLESILRGGLRFDRQAMYSLSFSSSLSKEVASEVISQLSAILYKIDESPLLQLNRSLHLSEYLLLSAKGSSGYRRARYLALLASVPSEDVVVADLSEFRGDDNRMVRFFALVAAINIERDNFAYHIASYGDQMTPFEVSYIIDRIRRGGYTVAYQPMLCSSNYNLNLLGISLVRAFGIGGSEERLLELIEQSRFSAIRLEALYTLALCRLDVASLSTRRLFRGLDESLRIRFISFCARAGYSESAIAGLASVDEQSYFHSIINSYKVKM